jgi:hypothetical protein
LPRLWVVLSGWFRLGDSLLSQRYRNPVSLPVPTCPLGTLDTLWKHPFVFPVPCVGVCPLAGRTTNQKAAGSSPAERAPETPASTGISPIRAATRTVHYHLWSRRQIAVAPKRCVPTSRTDGKPGVALTARKSAARSDPSRPGGRTWRKEIGVPTAWKRLDRRTVEAPAEESVWDFIRFFASASTSPASCGRHQALGQANASYSALYRRGICRVVDMDFREFF